MKANNSIVQRGQARNSFSSVINGETMQKVLFSSLKDENSVKRFAATLISAVSTSQQLQNCRAETIIQSALRGEGMGLVYGLGYYLLPFGNTCTFTIGYKGYIQMAISTGQYQDMDCLEVREGEIAGRDKRTGRTLIDLSVYDTDEERMKHPIVGYYAYYILKDGTFRYEYWPMEKILEHADHYSNAFSIEQYRKMRNGELSADQTAKLLRGSPWYDEGGGQVKMAKKTVLRQLLTSGYAPLSNEVKYDMSFDSTDEKPLYEGRPILFTDDTPAIEAESQVAAADHEPEAEPAPEATKQKRKTAAKETKSTTPAELDVIVDDFFGGGAE